MRFRRAAITVVATIGLALTGAAPALADHDTPERHDHPNPPGGNVTCEFLGLDFLDKIEYDGDQPTSVDVDPADYPGETIIAVIVKAGNASFVYTTPPFEHMTGPDGKEISHIELCKGDEPTPTPTPTHEPTKTPTHEPTKTPVPVPTEVPAGSGAGGQGALIGALAALTIALTAGAAFVRRRFGHES